MPFPIPEVHRDLLESIITKLEWESYCHLQQTCKYMRDLPQGNPKIRVEVDKFCELKPDGSIVLFGRNANYVVDMKSFNGVCIRTLKPSPNIVEFDKCCDVLKKYHITATFMTMNANYDDNEMTTGECEALFKILKPTGVTLNSQGSNRFEALSQAKQLEKVYVHVDPTNALLAMKLLYTRVKSVSLFVWAPTPRTNDDVFDLLLSVLEVLRLQTEKSMTREFSFQDGLYDHLPPLDELMETFRDFKPKLISDSEGHNQVRHLRFRCSLGPNGTCELYLGYCGAHIEYNRLL